MTGRGDGNELTGLAKIGYKPIGLALGMLGALIAGKIFGLVWKRVSNEDETPHPLSDDYSTREVLFAATLQGALFGLVKAAVDRYGMKGVRWFLDGSRAGDRRQMEV
ncbi:MAG: DUF4235 domain-containing protein [Pseudonocardia sp.]